MNYSGKALVWATVACAPGALMAQEFSGVGTLGYAHSSASNGGSDISSFTFDGAGAVRFQNGVHLGFQGTLAKIDPDQSVSDVDETDLGLTFNYQFNNGAVLGAYVDHTSLTTNNFLGGVSNGDITSYGLSGGYVNEQFGAELFIGESETSPSLPAGTDWTDYGVNMRYAVSERFRIGGHYMISELSLGSANADLSSYGVGGSYGFTGGWSGFAGVNHFDIDGADTDATTFGMGVGYDLRQVTQTPAIVSLELARTDISSGGQSSDIDTIRFGVTVPLGNGNAEPPLNSVARSVMSPRHNSVSTAINTVF